MTDLDSYLQYLSEGSYTQFRSVGKKLLNADKQLSYNVYRDRMKRLITKLKNKEITKEVFLTQSKRFKKYLQIDV